MNKIKLPILLLLLIVTSILVPSHITAEHQERVLIMFEEQIDHHIIIKNGGEIIDELPSIKAVIANVPEEAILLLQEANHIQHIELDQKITIQAYWSDWGTEKIQSPRAWQQNLTGQGVKVAVLDTGVFPHPDLHIHKGKSFVDYTTSFADDNGHGTHIAGIIAAGQNPNGQKGIAPDVELYAAKVLDLKGDGYHSNVIKAIDWAVENEVDIINLSVGGKDSTKVLEIALQKAYNEHNILIVAAAGNNGDRQGKGNTVEYPAAYESVIAVSATEKNDQRATFSGNGDAVELSAPGVRIKSTYTNNNYKILEGTSMAAPHVTGMLALLKQAQPSKTNEELRQLIRQYTKDLGVTGKDPLYGYGRLEFPKEIEVESLQLVQPTSPTNIQLKKITDTEILLTWDHSEETIFSIYRDGKKITEVSDQFSFSEKLTKGHYIYEVTAKNNQDLESERTKPLTISILQTPDYRQAANHFTDVSTTDWYIESLYHIHKDNIVGGYPNGTFQPNRFVTRAELANMLGKALNLNGVNRETIFPDVHRQLFASGFIQTAYDKGLISGYPDGLFRPYQTVTREEVAVFLTRAFPLHQTATETFPDVNNEHYAFPSIQQIVGEKVAYGYPDGTFRPKQGVTRAEFITFLYRTLYRKS